MKQILIITLMLTWTATTYSQSTDKTLGIALGVGHLKKQDLSFSPMTHAAWSPVNVALSYGWAKNLDQQVLLKFGQYHAEVGETYQFTTFFNKEPATTAPHTFTLVDINYSLGKKVLETETFKITLGGRVRNRLFPSDYIFASSGSFGYYISQGIDVWGKLDYEISENQRFQANVFLPVISMNSRSPYLSQNDEYFADNYSHKALNSLGNYIKRGQLESWGTSQMFDLNITYLFSLNERWSIGAGYWLSINANKQPTHFGSIENDLLISSTLTF